MTPAVRGKEEGMREKVNQVGKHGKCKRYN